MILELFSMQLHVNLKQKKKEMFEIDIKIATWTDIDILYIVPERK